MKLRLNRSSCNCELSIRRYKSFPHQSLCLLKELLKSLCLKFCHLKQNSISRSQPKITPYYGTLVALKGNLSVLSFEHLVIKAFYFAPYNSFKSKGRCCYQLISHRLLLYLLTSSFDARIHTSKIIIPFVV